MRHSNFNIPKSCTKNLKLQACKNDKRKLVISTNWLVLFGFESGVATVEEVIGENKGMLIRLAIESDSVTKKVYSRAYKSRRNNPIESLIDIRGQSKINKAFGGCNQVHITFRHGAITIIPITTAKAKIIKRAKSTPDMLRAFVACSSGIDAHSMNSQGFSIDALLEFRPPEKRDRKNLSETGALCALENVAIKHVFNEDIFTIDTHLLKKTVDINKTALFSISTQCDDFSNVKAASLKKKSLDDLTTTTDMVYDALRIIEECLFPYVLLENVPNLLKTDFHRMFETRLRRWGYRVYSDVIDASEHGGVSKRKRAYVFATIFNEIPFSFPKPLFDSKSSDFWEKNVAPFLKDCRDVTHCKSIQDGANIGRLRVVSEASTVFPTLLKSQSRQAKDSLVILYRGRYFFPSEELEKHIMGIPKDFSFNGSSKSIASEVVGQGVEYISHGEIINNIKSHINLVKDSLRPFQLSFVGARNA